jgi:uncharacterized membrane protein
MALLILGIILFLGLHLLPTVPNLRNYLIGRLGERPYRALFGVLSVAAFVVLVWGFARAPVIQVWSPPSWTRWVAIVLMIPAFILLVAAYVPGQIKAKVRHPFLVAIKTWALAHLIANGDLASVFLFGSFLLYAVYDRIAVKRREEIGGITVSETGLARNDVISVVVGLLLYVAFLLWLHPLLIGTSPLQASPT